MKWKNIISISKSTIYLYFYSIINNIVLQITFVIYNTITIAMKSNMLVISIFFLMSFFILNAQNTVVPQVDEPLEFVSNPKKAVAIFSYSETNALQNCEIVIEDNSMLMGKRKKVSLVLSGGGARGIAHIGVLEELEKHGYEIVSISGTSMGALVGAVYCAGYLEEFKSWICTMDKVDIINLIDFSYSTQGLIKGDKIFEKLKDFLPDKNIEDLKIHLTITATDIKNRKEVVFEKGSVYDAVRASIAIPTVFTPVITANSILIDGGVLNNIPINNIKRTKNDILIVVNVNADTPLFKPVIRKEERKKRQTRYQVELSKFKREWNILYPESNKLGYFDLINETLSLQTFYISQMMIKNHPPDILINISRKSCAIFDFLMAEELIEIGRFEAAKILNPS